MVKKMIIVALVLTIALGGWFAYYFSDKMVIKRQLVGLGVELGKEGQETPVQMALKMRHVMDMLPVSCQVRIPELGYVEVLEQDLIIRYLMYHRSRYALLSVAFEDVVIDIPAKGQATVQTTVRLQRKKVNQTDVVKEVQQVELVLSKSDNKWLLQAVTMPEALVQ